MSAFLLPPGPKGHFLVGNLPEFGRDLLGFLTKCARDYGDVVRFRLGKFTCYLVSRPDHIEYVLVTNHRNFIKHRFFWRRVGAIFGNGLLTSEGDFWVRQRRMVQPAFYHQRIQRYGEVMVGFTEQMLNTYRDGDIRDAHQDMMRLTSQIAAKCLLDANIAEKLEEVEIAVEAALRETTARYRRFFPIPDVIPTPGNLRYRRVVRRLDEIIYAFIRERQASCRDPGDLLSMLLHAHAEEGGRMTEHQLRDEVITLFLAGYETTALALSWTWYLLSEHPGVDTQLTAELQAVLGGQLPAVADLVRLRYSEMVVAESMRLYPPAYAIGREALHDCEIGGYHIPAGTTVLMSQWVTHRDRRYFEEPEKFKPDRWAGDFARRVPKYAYFPFGGGPRVCIGNSFAMMEAILVLATIAQKFRLVLVPSHPVIPWPSMMLRPRHGLKVVLARR